MTDGLRCGMREQRNRGRAEARPLFASIFKQALPILPERTELLPGILLFGGDLGAKRGPGASLPASFLWDMSF